MVIQKSQWRAITALGLYNLIFLLISGSAYATEKIYWADYLADKIQRANLDGSSAEDVITGLMGPYHIDVDLVASKIYWTHYWPPKIQRANLDGSSVENLITGLDMPYGIALDVAGGKMYWTDPGSMKIQRANLDGTDIENLVTEVEAYDIALDLSGGKIYWAICFNDIIQRANLDGSAIETIVAAEGMVNGIDLDTASGKIYWTYSSLLGEGIQRANLDGSSIETLVTLGSSSPGDIVLYLPDGKMYWTNYWAGSIQRANLDGNNVEDIVTGLFGPDGIAIPTIPYTDNFKIEPVIGFNSSGEKGGPFTPDSKSYTLQNIGPNSISWTASVTQDWLDVSPSSGILGPNEVNTIQININSNADVLNYGSYSDILTITNLTSGIAQNRSIELRVCGPIIELSQNEFYFEAYQDGNNPANRVLGISNIGVEILNWQASETCDWLSVDPNWGSSASEVDEVNIIIDISGLTRGLHICEILVSSDDAENSPQVVTVSCSIITDTTKLYWTDSGTQKIQRANLDGSYVDDIVTTGLKLPRHIAFDSSAGKIYWTDAYTNKIQRANPNGSSIEDLITGLNYPYGIALDIASGKIYWTCHLGEIQRSNLDGSNIEELITGLNYPEGIALDTLGGKMYWGSSGKIQRANLDGSSIEDLVTAEHFIVRSVALDLTNGKLYWTNYSNGHIQRANLDGSSVESLADTYNPQGLVLDLPGGKMYWTEEGTRKLQRANLDGSNFETILTGLMDSWGITIADNIETDDLWVAPLDGFKSEGREGGPFAPESFSYTLENIGPNNISWAASVTQDWLVVSPSSGTLGPDDVNTIQTSISSNASGLGPGIYEDTLTINNLTSGCVQKRTVKLIVISKFKLTASDGDSDDHFGWSVSIDGDRCIVGAYWDEDNGQGVYNGSAYIFQWNGDAWIEQVKLTLADGSYMETFGCSVGIDGDRCIVGTIHDETMGANPNGRTFIFGWNGTTWTQQAELDVWDGINPDRFGESVSISGDRCIVGDTYNGSAYIFAWNGAEWIQQAKLTSSDGNSGDRFGSSVCLNGNRCIVGAVYDDDNGHSSGSAYIFEWDGSNWVQQDKLLASDGAAEDCFGHSVDIYSDRCIVGAPGDDDNGNHSGSAYIFEWVGESWNELKFPASETVGSGSFGWSVGISDNRCIIGTPCDDDNGSCSGSAYVYLPYNLSDLNRNRRVDLYDFSVLASQWLQEPGLPSADIAPSGGDGFVDYEDLAVFCQSWLD